MPPKRLTAFIQRTTLFPLLFFAASAFGQTDSTSRQVTDVFRIGFFNPGVSYEKAIGTSHTLFGQVFFNTLIAIRSTGSPGKSFEMRFDPAVLLQYRYYYNYQNRKKDNKRTALNSLNYVGPVAQVSWPGNASVPFTDFGVVWGFQRNYPKRFSLDLNMGFGYRSKLTLNETSPGNTNGYEVRGRLGLIGQISLGFWLNRR